MKKNAAAMVSTPIMRISASPLAQHGWQNYALKGMTKRAAAAACLVYGEAEEGYGVQKNMRRGNAV